MQIGTRHLVNMRHKYGRIVVHTDDRWRGEILLHEFYLELCHLLNTKCIRKILLDICLFKLPFQLI